MKKNTLGFVCLFDVDSLFFFCDNHQHRIIDCCSARKPVVHKWQILQTLEHAIQAIFQFILEITVSRSKPFQSDSTTAHNRTLLFQYALILFMALSYLDRSAASFHKCKTDKSNELLWSAWFSLQKRASWLVFKEHDIFFCIVIFFPKKKKYFRNVLLFNVSPALQIHIHFRSYSFIRLNVLYEESLLRRLCLFIFFFLLVFVTYHIFV